MIILTRLCALFLIILPLLSAHPTRHISFHRRRNHHRHAHPLGIHLSPSQRPLLNPDPSTRAPELNRTEVLVRIYFTSIPKWPKSGEQADFLTIPLDTWITPREHPSLPLRPLKARIIQVQHQAQPLLKDVLPRIAAQATCSLYFSATDQGSSPSDLNLSQVAISFRMEDQITNLEDPKLSWYMDGRTVERFGCV